jgi:uncharacterized lipoprotein YddW (UPF0748 family)
MVGTAIRRARLLLAGLVLILALSTLTTITAGWSSGADQSVAPGRPQEVRALWVVRTTLTSPEAIRTMVQTARENGFNTLVVQVRGRGDAYYASRWEPRAKPLETQPKDFDPLRLAIAEAHKAGLQVHAWLNTCLLANLEELPDNPQHVFNAHPDWLMVPRPVAAALATMDPASPDYRRRIVEWSKGDLTELEGVYASPAHPAVQEHFYNLWMDVVERYDVDGVHFDYVRFPNAYFDYSRMALDRFRAEIEKDLGDGERRAFAQLLQTDPLILTTVYATRWDQFRRDLITNVVERIATGVRQRRPKVRVSAAVFADDQDAYARRFQDWKLWTERGLLDIVCPMAYTPDTETFKRQIAIARGFSFGRQVWAGIGAYRQAVPGTLEKIDTARRIGADGIILFSYDSLTRPSETNPLGDYLKRVRERAFGGIALTKS